MIYVKFENGVAVSSTSNFKDTQSSDGRYDNSFQSRHDWKSFEQVQKIAAELTEATGTEYLASDAGDHCSPRYDIFEAPVVGAEISYAFNGDYYPCGVIEKITANGRFVWSSTGKKFIRQKQSARYISNGTWSMVSGHIKRQNQEF